MNAKAESNRKDEAGGWIPGPACGRPGMTPHIPQSAAIAVTARARCAADGTAPLRRRGQSRH
jgi:hypothetical protein